MRKAHAAGVQNRLRPVKAVTVCGQVCGGLGGTGIRFRLGGAGDTFVHQRLFQNLGAHRG